MGEIGEREIVQLCGLSFNKETILMTWLAMAVVILISALATRNLKIVPTTWQNIVEMIVVWLHGQIDAMMGRRGRMLAPFIVSLFMFLLVSNWLGLIPHLASPTNDINTTLGLALLVICLVHVLGLYYKGMHYIAHFFQPFKIFILINLIEEIAKPITLAFRLFGNILAGEILIIVLLQLVPWWMPIPSVLWLMFSIFIGVVQAVVFTMLSSAYLSNVVKEEGHE